MERNQKNLSQIAEWLLNQFIPESSNWKIDIINGFTGEDLKSAIKNGYSTDELVERIINDSLVDPSYYSDHEIKTKIYDAVSELKGFSEDNDWGFYIRSVPGVKREPEKIEDGLEGEAKHEREYKLLIYDSALLLKIAKLVDNPNEAIAQQRRWVDAVGRTDRSKSRSYGQTANNLLDAGREYTELLDQNGLFELPSWRSK